MSSPARQPLPSRPDEKDAAPAAPSAASRPVEPLPGGMRVLATVSIALVTAMTVLDTTIANVALPTIAGNLGVAPSQGTLVITFYGVANAIAIPLTGWLARRFGEVRVFTLATFFFVLASLLCGLSHSLLMLIAARIIQGAAAGPLIPLWVNNSDCSKVRSATSKRTGRLMPDGRVRTGTPADFQPRQAFLTPDGDCYLLDATAHAALLDGADLAAVSFINAQGRLATDADWEHGPGPGWQLRAGRFCLPLQTVSQEAIPMQCGFLRQPYP